MTDVELDSTALDRADAGGSDPGTPERECVVEDAGLDPEVARVYATAGVRAPQEDRIGREGDHEDGRPAKTKRGFRLRGQSGTLDPRRPPVESGHDLTLAYAKALGDDVPHPGRTRSRLAKYARSQQPPTADPIELVFPEVHYLTETFSFLVGGRDRFVGLVELAAQDEDPSAIAWVQVYRSMTKGDQHRVSFDDVCAVCGVSPWDLGGAITSVAIKMGVQIGDYLAASAHPRLVRQTIKSAVRIGGSQAHIAQKDRQTIFQHNKFLPQPKGSSIQINNQAVAASRASAAATDSPSVPSFIQDMDGVTAAKDKVQRQLIEAPCTTEE